MSSTQQPQGVPPAPAPDAAVLVGRQVRVVARRGYIVEGTCLDVWRLRNGGTALTIKPADGSPPRELTTLLPVTLVADRR